jgi:hypothetical protein
MIRSFFFAAGFFALLSGPVAADCGVAAGSCRMACQSRLGAADQDAARAGCMARCGTDQAACVAQSAIDEAGKTAERDVLPWIDRQTERARSLLDEFWRRNPQKPDESKTKDQQL